MNFVDVASKQKELEHELASLQAQRARYGENSEHPVAAALDMKILHKTNQIRGLMELLAA